MLELEKRNIHRNRLKSQTGTQVTLDDDFIVPDTMDDISEVILDSGLIKLEPVIRSTFLRQLLIFASMISLWRISSLSLSICWRIMRTSPTSPFSVESVLKSAS